MTAIPSRMAVTPTNPKPDLKLSDPFFTIGGPIKKDKLNFFASYEKSNRTLPSVNNITATTIAALSIPSTETAAYDFSQANQFVFGRMDWQINDKNRLMGRYMYFRNDSPNNPNSGTAGGLKFDSTASTEFVDRAHAAGSQLVTTFTPTIINEFRFALGYRNEVEAATAKTPTGPQIVISGLAVFGGPDDVTSAIIKEVSPEFVDNISIVRGKHNLKYGGTIRPIYDTENAAVFAQYNFNTIQAYLDAASGKTPKGYASYVQTSGNPNLSYSSVFYGFFAQDTWTVNSRLSLTYGMRYDLYKMPDAATTSTLPFNQNFKLDKNNFAPRFGGAYSLSSDHKTVLRFNAAFFFDPPQTDFYRRAILNNGSPQYFNGSLLPTDAGAPSFPNVVSGGNQPAQAINGLSKDFANLYAFNTNVVLVRELNKDTSLLVGFLHTKGSRLPVARNYNYTKVTGRLADGRPIFSTAAADRTYPQFTNVYVDESVGNSVYDALTVSLNKRFAHDFQVQVNYAWSHAIDNAPEENVLDSGAGFAVSDPTNIRRDRGNSPTDRRHIFTMNGVWDPTFNVADKGLNYFLNHNQLAFFVNMASGDPFNIVANSALLGPSEATRVSRPNFVGRDTFRGQRIGQVDVRYSRFIPIRGDRIRAEVLAEASNLFNHTNATGYNLTASVFAQPQPTGSTNIPGNLSAPFAPLASATRDPRYIQIGFKLLF